ATCNFLSPKRKSWPALVAGGNTPAPASAVDRTFDRTAEQNLAFLSACLKHSGCAPENRTDVWPPTFHPGRISLLPATHPPRIGAMKSLLLTLSVLSLAPLATLDAADPARTGKPNVLVIVADDLGYGDIGVHGGEDVPTPHIDALATRGVRCTNGYVSAPYCSPSRAGFLTGRCQTRFGHEFNPHV